MWNSVTDPRGLFVSLQMVTCQCHKFNQQIFRFCIFIKQLDLTDFYDEDYDLTDDDDEEESNGEYADGDDSGNGET